MTVLYLLSATWFYHSQKPLFKKTFYLFIYFRDKGRKGEREGEKHQCVVASRVSPTVDLACNPGMCPDWESNWQPFGLQAGAQTTEMHQPGQKPLLSSRPYSQFQAILKSKRDMPTGICLCPWC